MMNNGTITLLQVTAEEAEVVDFEKNPRYTKVDCGRPSCINVGWLAWSSKNLADRDNIRIRCESCAEGRI